MVDRLGDPVLISGQSDHVLADRVHRLARSVREERGLGPHDGPVGKILWHHVPLMVAQIKGEAAPAFGGAEARATVREHARAIMQATAFYVPGETDFLKDPAQGNPAAILLDRFAAKLGVPRAEIDESRGSDPDLSARVGGNPKILGLVTGPTGPLARGLDDLAVRMLEKTGAAGHHQVPYWSPGHEAPPVEEGPFTKLLTPETRLELRAESVYAARLHSLPDAELAREILDTARDMRVRHGLDPERIGGYHRYMAFEGIPAMAKLIDPDIELQPREMAKFHRPSDENQVIFEALSSSVMNAYGEGSRYIVHSPDSGLRPTLAERVMFKEPSNGNSMGILLDRIAAKYEVERGREYDLVGRSVVEVSKTRGFPSRYDWSPEIDRPKAPAKKVGVAAAMAAQALSR